MESNPEQIFAELRTRALGRPVRSRRLAANSLLVYVDAEPGEKAGLTFWLEPTWHLRGPDRVLTGSREAQDDPDGEDPEAGFRRAADAVDALIGRSVEDVWIEDVTGDLFLTFSGDLLLRTFVSDPGTDELWHLKDNEAGITLYRSPGGFEIRHPPA